VGNRNCIETKRFLAFLTAAAFLVVGAGYALVLFVQVGNAIHMQSAVSGDLAIVYRDVREYREANSRWPASLDVAAKRPGSVLYPGHFLSDPISKQPFLYFPGATPETRQVLLAQPAPIAVRFWPFTIQWREGIAADGTVVDLSHVPVE
jgi:hypothetical protein